MRLNYKEWKCNLVADYYTSGHRYILLEEVGTGDMIADATVNVPEYKSSGLEHALKLAGLIEDTKHKTIWNGWVNINEFKLTPKALKLWVT